MKAALAQLVPVALALTLGACSDDPGPTPVFPADAPGQWLEMRDCRHSHEHELRYIRVFASPTAEASYAALSPDTPYPEGAVLLKLEYDDAGCTELLEYTAMQKLKPGASPDGGDWLWQRVSVDREVTEEGAPPVCLDCHRAHCEPPYGYDLTCDEEI